ncbi:MULTISPECIES: LysM peptidoglycan-binding domain-containing protein [Brevibacillus]|uniref:LysM peptidoglycan-binding domain-containing protein n=1 Tax=Brevibacillus TaxID=55080 RepID=UPI001490A8BC|nr:LysM peptidoglycan-binding domain-containing protein [Brevibacillus aydinogluensis]MBR8658595.1 LysM peptidoglycan-binding domain-containing protein [Brevibacillus sp. NL20B1]MDT3415335.1 nucleoid-associated protein YgaU [Brevibacillus aydinogluensis]
MTKGRSKRMPETFRVSPESDVHELPPRRLRHKRGRLSYKAVLSSGLAIFGSLFLVLVAAELYQAHQTSSNPPGNETARAEQAAAGQTSAIAQADGSAPSAPPVGSAAVSGGEGGQAAAIVNSPSSGSLPNESAQTKANAVAGTASEKPATEQTNATTPASFEHTSSSGKVQAAKPAPKPKVKRHVVQKGETLFMLSRLYYGNNGGVSRIARYNGISPEAKLKAGDVLSIPLSP